MRRQHARSFEENICLSGGKQPERRSAVNDRRRGAGGNLAPPITGALTTTAGSDHEKWYSFKEITRDPPAWWAVSTHFLPGFWRTSTRR